MFSVAFAEEIISTIVNLLEIICPTLSGDSNPISIISVPFKPRAS